jgi:hypothetical protein
VRERVREGGEGGAIDIRRETLGEREKRGELGVGREREWEWEKNKE